MSTEIAKSEPMSAQIEQVLINGNLANLAPEQRVSYYNAVCNSLGLNPLTRPFEYITLNSKLTLYAKRDCTEQLRKLHGVSLTITSREILEGCYVVTARAVDARGRTDESTGAVPIDGLKGEARANALMKAETKAKRRVTLSVCGLGCLDESEADSIPGGVLASMAARVESPAPKMSKQVPSREALPPPAQPTVATLMPVEPPPQDEDLPPKFFDVDSDEPQSNRGAVNSTREPAGDDVECFAWQKGKNGQGGFWKSTGYQPRRSLAQNQKLHAMLKEGGYGDDAKKAACGRYGKSSTAELSIDEMGDMIDRLEKKMERAREASAEIGDAFAEPGTEG